LFVFGRKQGINKYYINALHIISYTNMYNSATPPEGDERQAPVMASKAQDVVNAHTDRIEPGSRNFAAIISVTCSSSHGIIRRFQAPGFAPQSDFHDTDYCNDRSCGYFAPPFP
jgi:hypothetical protein